MNPWTVAEQMHTDGNREWLPVTEAFWWEMLEVLPPVYVGKWWAVSEAWKHDSNGNELLLFFREKPTWACRIATRGEIRLELDKEAGRKSMMVGGIVADTQAIANGLYDIIVKTGQEAVVAFGMLPAELMNKTEEMLREKVISEAAKQRGCRVEEITPYVDKAAVDKIVRPIMHAISSDIYAAAKRAGKMIV